MHATICPGSGGCQRLVRRRWTRLVPARMTKRDSCSACVLVTRVRRQQCWLRPWRRRRRSISFGMAGPVSDRVARPDRAGPAW